ncbi:MAG: LuxR C-terminal-related transcriptional regulator [Pseudomonadaceae bacterium]|nr:LuxR C-terminal-related transcriptional regulator [Pseudomonadaceae bacterium]
MTAETRIPNRPLLTELGGLTPSLVLKLTPPRLRKSLLARERLSKLRASVEDVAVILLEAPAGYGKTSLLAQWRLDWLHAGALVTWFDLDSNDSVTSLGSGIVEGLRRASGQANFGHDAREALLRGSGLEQAATTLLAEIAETAHPTVIILDNGERINDTALIELCDYLLHNLPANLQIVIGSRSRLPLAVNDLVAHGNLRRVSAKQLQFDLNETHNLLNQRFAEKASIGLAARLHELTEGWPLGLQLAVTAMEQASDPEQALQHFSHSGDETTQQLLAGFLAHLAPGLADFLLRCALLDALHPELCTAISEQPNAAALLEQLRSESALLSSVDNSQWLRLHPLIREYLRSQAAQQLPVAEQQAIHRRAWQWLAAHDNPEEAARHALAAGHKHEAFALIADNLYDSCMKEGHYGTVADWLARLPAAEIFQHPALRLTAGWQAALSGDWQRAEHFVGSLAEPSYVPPELYCEALAILAVANSRAERLDAARHYSEAFPSDAPDSLAARSMVHIKAFTALFRGASEEARHLLLSIQGEHGYFAQSVFHDRSLGHIYLWEGRPVLAEAAVRRRYGECEARAGRRNELTMTLAAVLASACWERDQRSEARTLLAARFDLSGRSGELMWSERSYLTQARIAAADGCEPRAFALLEALTAVGASQGILSTHLLGLLERIRLHATRQRSGQCAALLADLEALFDQAAPLTAQSLHPLLHLYRALAHSYTALSAEQNSEASRWLTEAWPLAQQLNRGREMVQILALQALVREQTGESPNSLLNAALSHAESGGQVRVFVDTLPTIVELIARSAAAGELNASISPGFVQRVLAAAQTSLAEPANPASLAPATAASAFLTPKETEVLQLLAAGLPNKRIASTLGLSNETIKWHMKKLFTKLNAGNRQHAVDRARLLGLLS